MRTLRRYVAGASIVAILGGFIGVLIETAMHATGDLGGQVFAFGIVGSLVQSCLGAFEERGVDDPD